VVTGRRGKQDKTLNYRLYTCSHGQINIGCEEVRAFINKLLMKCVADKVKVLSAMFIPIPPRNRPALHWVTPLFMVLLWGSYVWARTRPEAMQQALLLEWGTLTDGTPPWQWWQSWQWTRRGVRLFSALLLHADWMHLTGNAVFLLIFGLPAERIMGSLRVLALITLGGAFANLLAVLALSGLPERVIIGASGAVSALIGAYLALFPRARLGVVVPLGLFLEFIRAPAALLIGLWAVLQVVFVYIDDGQAFGGVAWVAHVGGFGFGFIFASVSRPAISRRLWRLRGY